MVETVTYRKDMVLILKNTKQCISNKRESVLFVISIQHLFLQKEPKVLNYVLIIVIIQKKFEDSYVRTAIQELENLMTILLCYGKL